MRSRVSGESRALRSLFHLKNVDRGGEPSKVRSSSADSPQAAVMLKNAVSAVAPNSSGSKLAGSAGRGWNIHLHRRWQSPVRDLTAGYSIPGLIAKPWAAPARHNPKRSTELR